MTIKTSIATLLTGWLTKEAPAEQTPLCDFERIRFEIRPCDVLLIEGRSRLSEVIKYITQSPWTHSALYLGRPVEIEDPTVRERVMAHFDGDPHEQIMLEALLGEGTIVAPLSKYQQEHIRICRPKSLSREDAARIVSYVAEHLGCDYDVRHLFDLARFMYPYSIIPRRWRSSLFTHHAGGPTRTVCSCLIAAAFSSVQYPILPVVQRSDDGRFRMFHKNLRLYTPPDFDYSPYFDIIKYPYLGFEDMAIYRRLPWSADGQVCNTAGDCFEPGAKDASRIAKPSWSQRLQARYLNLLTGWRGARARQ